MRTCSKRVHLCSSGDDELECASEAAIDTNILPSDPASLLRDEQEYRITHVFDSTVPIRSPRFGTLGSHEEILHALGYNVRDDGAGGNRIDRDATAAAQLWAHRRILVTDSE